MVWEQKNFIQNLLHRMALQDGGFWISNKVQGLMVYLE